MSADGLKISLPCSSCSEPVRFGDRVCSSCGAAVSRNARKALDGRLEAADPDFRALKSNVGTASVILLVLAGAHLVFGLLLYLVNTGGELLPPTAAELADARIDLIGNGFISVTMAACFAWSRRAPTPALATALGLWIGVQITSVSIGGMALFGLRIFAAKVVVFAMLLRGIVSAVTAARLRRKLAPTRPAPLPNARVIAGR